MDSKKIKNKEQWADAEFTKRLLSLYRDFKQQETPPKDFLGNGTDGVVFAVPGPIGENMVGKVFKDPMYLSVADLYVSKTMTGRPESRLVHSNVFVPKNETTPLVTRMLRHQDFIPWVALQRRQINTIPGAQKVLLACRDISCGLANLHALNWAHFDLKPSNILVRQDRAYLSDFGLTSAANGTSSMPEVVTMGYRAPELYTQDARKNLKFTEKVDMWSLGIVYLDVLTTLFFKNVIQMRTSHISRFVQPLDTVDDIESFVGQGLTADSLWISICGSWASVMANKLKYSDEKILPIVKPIVEGPTLFYKPLCECISHLLVLDPASRWSARQVVQYWNRVLGDTTSGFLNVPMDCKIRSPFAYASLKESNLNAETKRLYLNRSVKKDPIELKSTLRALAMLPSAKRIYPDIPTRDLEKILLTMLTSTSYENIPSSSMAKFLARDKNDLFGRDAEFDVSERETSNVTATTANKQKKRLSNLGQD